MGREERIPHQREFLGVEEERKLAPSLIQSNSVIESSFFFQVPLPEESFYPEQAYCTAPGKISRNITVNEENCMGTRGGGQEQWLIQGGGHLPPPNP